MNKIKAMALAFLRLKAFNAVDNKPSLTEPERARLLKAFGTDFMTQLDAAIAQGEKEASATDEQKASLVAVSAQLAQAEALAATMQSQLDILSQDKTTNASRIGTFESTIASLNAQIEALSASAEHFALPPASGAGAPSLNLADDKFLCGIQAPYMAIDSKRPYNQRAYSALMASQGIIVPYRKESALDYASLTADLGAFYRERKNDQITAVVALMNSCEKAFPLLSGYQDQTVLVNMFMDEFSQAENTVGSSFSNLVKGTYKFEPEILTMYGVMFAHNFTDLKKMEKEWIGFLNKEGSKTIKMSLIQYILTETAKQLHNEREIRRISGVYKAPTANVAGAAINGADGFRKFIKKQIAAFKVKPFPMGEWSDATIYSHVTTGTSLIPEAWRSTGRVVCYAPIDAIAAYNRNVETLFGTNMNYKGDIMYVKGYDNVRLEPIPNMGNSKRIVWSLDGNFHTFEDQANEMLDFSIEQQDWNLKVWSNWKESVWATIVGKKFASAAAMPSDYSTQVIWCNDVDEPATYFINMAADDATPSCIDHTSICSVANAAALAITGFDDVAVGSVVRLKIGNATNAPTIAKSGVFSLISAAITAPALGDVYHFMKRSDGKFIDIKRELVASDAIALADGDATPSVAAGNTFVTVANTAALEITNLDNAVAGVNYTIYGGSNSNAATMEDGGNFVLTALMTLSLGKWIVLRKSEVSGAIIEISRG